MPIYEYTCPRCQEDFEQLVMGNQKPECPKCHGNKLIKRFSVISTPASGDSTSGQVCDPLPGGG